MVLTVGLAACGGDDDARPTATAQPTPATAASPAGTSAPTPPATLASSASTTSVATSTNTGSPTVSVTATTAATPTAQAAASPTALPARELACGAEITESVTLANDLTCDPVGLVVAAGGVVLDLGGHTITGPGPGTRGWPLPSFDVPGVLVLANDVTIRNGTIVWFGLSVLVNEQRGATIQNVKTDGSYYGIYLFHGGGHRIENNTVTNNVYGLHLQESNDNVVLGNALSYQTHHSPGGYGLYLYASSNNWFEGNTVAYNLNWGLWFSDSTGNTIVRNNIIANDPQVSDDSGGNTYYDAERREGNYWSDYQGEDANADGVGDIPYGIGGPGRSVDIYPFKAENGWQNRATQTQSQATPPARPELEPRVYVALDDGSVAAIDPEHGTLLDTWPGSTMGGNMAISPDGTQLYAISGDGEAANVVAIDTSTGEVVDSWEIVGAGVLAATYDGERVIVSSSYALHEIVLDTGEVRQQEDGADAIAITPSWKHNLVLVTDARWNINVVYLPDQHAPYKMALPGPPVYVVDNRAGTRLYALIEELPDVLVIDTEQFLVTDEVPLGDISAVNARLAPSPDGTTLYVLDRATSRVVAIDLGTKQVVAEVTVGGSALDLAVGANGEHLSVATREGEAGRLVVFDTDLRPTASIDLSAAPTGVAAPK
jgi:parallel beta-helix repeat protein/YVTN family beta-propeller protein